MVLLATVDAAAKPTAAEKARQNTRPPQDGPLQYASPYTLKMQEMAAQPHPSFYFHSSGACRMGKDDKAVVDSQLRVNGVHNLRIADSTIMPRIVAVPTMPACVLIGLRLAEMLVGRGSSRREREQ
jgi:choline dehydrogenase-like flavoprotein